MVEERSLKLPCVIDESPRECAAFEVGASLRAQDTILMLSRLMRLYGKLARICPDNGAEFNAAIHAPSSTKKADNAQEPEMHQFRKCSQWYFGMKAHIGVDEFPWLLPHVKCTSANEVDVTVTHELLHRREAACWATAAALVRTSQRSWRTARRPSSSPRSARRCRR